MTLFTKLAALINSAIELPGALHACVEMAREADYSRHEMERLPSELNTEIERLQSELNREREARRLRRYRFDVSWGECQGEPPPAMIRVAYRDCNSEFSSRGEFKVGVPVLYCCIEWRYLSPEDMT